ncbi:hypothetical protein SCAR479_11057 [Seiridium cardinale]|uniref:DOC domain-containing protein n=1 Tax=Seiridium cardinale TaxID=138064 RepID=A0ABR2XEN0_9PEZI
MEYNWSWLPARRATTPPPLRSTQGELQNVEVFEELNGGIDRARRQHFMRSFPHDDTENEGPRHFRPSVDTTLDSFTNFSQAIAGRNDNGDDVDNDDAGDENGEDAEITVDEDAEEGEEEEGEDDEPLFDPASVGLKEISNLASFTVSSYKPGCGVKELRDDDVHLFWQSVALIFYLNPATNFFLPRSDGPQPHRLNIHFIKRVEIRALRLYLDYELDESYTPTKIQITAGFGPNLTIPFTTMELSMPKGWIDIPIAGAGGGPDGNSLCCWFVRVIILENHQNGKDTHLRGVKVYALDDNADTAENNPVEDMVEVIDDYEDRMTRMNIHDQDEGAQLRHEAEVQRKKAAARKFAPGDGGLSIPDFMREPEIR